MNQSKTPTKNEGPPIPAPLVAIDSTGNGIQLRFCWQGDRFGHVIEVMKDGVATNHLLRSLESDAQEYWPSSPPIQQVSLEQIGDAPTALGVGATGTGHWSISIQAGQIQDKIGLVFDVALKFSMTPVRCGSGYALVNGASPNAVPQDKIFDVLPLSNIAPTMIQSFPSLWQIVPQQAGASPQEISGANPEDHRGTIRWAYFISLV